MSDRKSRQHFEKSTPSEISDGALCKTVNYKAAKASPFVVEESIVTTLLSGSGSKCLLQNFLVGLLISFGLNWSSRGLLLSDEPLRHLRTHLFDLLRLQLCQMDCLWLQSTRLTYKLRLSEYGSMLAPAQRPMPPPEQPTS